MILIKYKNIGSHMIHYLHVVSCFGVNSNTVQPEPEINLTQAWDFRSLWVNHITLIMVGMFSMQIQIVILKNGMINMISWKI